MKGDFTRNTFDPRKHFTRVLMQQGRVQLDADWNEQTAILLHYLRSLAADLIGPHGGPSAGFRIGVDAATLGLTPAEWDELKLEPPETGDFYIRPGHYYVDGILCENEGYTLYSDQPDLSNEPLEEDRYLVYLDVWERHITYIQDESIREVALGGPDTATRSKLVWQVKAWPSSEEDRGDAPTDLECADVQGAWGDWVKLLQPENRGQLKAEARITEDVDTGEPCITPPEARYRGAENQLYRVEIHRGGQAGDATFKWSRDSGAVVFPIRKVATDSTAGTTTISLDHLGRDSRFSLEEGDWVEIVDDDYVLHGRAEHLLKVKYVDRVDIKVTLEGMPPSTSGQDPNKHPLLRRWDQTGGDPGEGGLALEEGAALIEEGTDEHNWLTLEDGIRIQFQPGATYRTGDYWLIPARTATGDVEWPQDADGDPIARPPLGVKHYYAPLAILRPGGIDDCRCVFDQLCPP